MVLSATVINATTVRFVFNQNMSVTLPGWSFLNNTLPLAVSAVAGALTTWDFTVTAVAAGDRLQYEYNAATGNTISSVTGIELQSTTSPQNITNTLLAILGYNIVGGNVYNETPNGILGQAGIAAFDGVSVNIVAYIAAPAGLTVATKYALYEKSGTDLNLIGVTNELIIDDVLQWRTIPLAGFNINLGTTYYVQEWAGAAYDMTYNFGGGPSMESFTFLYVNGYPATITAAQRSDYGDSFSIYLEYLPN